MDAALPRLRFPIEGAADPAAVFGPPPARIAFEVGFGGGEHALAQVADPHLCLIACEVFETGLCSLLSNLVPVEAEEDSHPLPGNLRVWDDDARVLLRALPPACLDMLFLLFPDPWPKARHAKRRFMHPSQVPLVARVLKPGAEWRVATDDPTYQQWVQDIMAAQSWFETDAPARTRPSGWPPTRYEAKARRAGREPLYWTFIRTTIAQTGGAEHMAAGW